MSSLYRTSYRRNGSPIGIDDSPTAIQWGRRLDDVSVASVEYTLPSVACCEGLAMLEPYADTIEVWRNDQLVWLGWVERVTYGRDTVLVEGMDALGWLGVRFLQADLKVAGVDYADVFEALWLDAVDASADLPIVYDKTLTGVTTTKEYLQASYQTAMDIARELFDTAVDATALGQRILFGDLSHLGDIELDIQDIEGDIALIKDGERYANEWIAKGADNTVATATTSPSAPYPLVSRVIEDQNLQNGTDAQAAADNRLASSPIVPRRIEFPEGAKLKTCEDKTFRLYVPGRRVQVDTTGLCVQDKHTMKLSTVDCTVSGESEEVTLGLIPVGQDSVLGT
jgi:hypothetical protein